MIKQTIEMFAEEDGSQLIEFIGVLPWLAAIILIGWQFFLAGHTFIITANAAREGARALAVCEGNAGFAQQAVDRSVPSAYTPLTNAQDGDPVTVIVTNKIPVIDIFKLVDEWMPDVRFTATMRKERCP